MEKLAILLYLLLTYATPDVSCQYTLGVFKFYPPLYSNISYTYISQNEYDPTNTKGKKETFILHSGVPLIVKFNLFLSAQHILLFIQNSFLCSTYLMYIKHFFFIYINSIH